MLSAEIADWEIARDVSEWIEVAAIVVIVIAVLVAFWSSLSMRLRGSTDDALSVFKKQIARGLLAGLDLLIAAGSPGRWRREPMIGIRPGRKESS